MDTERKDAYFTKSSILKEYATLIRESLKGRDIFYVDTSAGTNEFALNLGFKYASFDIDIDYAEGNVTQKDWLNVKTIPSDSKTLIGLNPPFGYQSKIARKFIKHALTFEPDFMVWILPARFRFSNEMKKHYKQLYISDVTRDAFYDPKTKRILDVWTKFSFWKRVSNIRKIESPCKKKFMGLMFFGARKNGPNKS